MSFLDFFKRKKEEVILPEKEEKVSLTELKHWLDKKSKENKKEKDSFLNSIKDRINILDKELEKEIDILEKIDLREKKEIEKIKIIVLKNLNNYINALKLYKSNLSSLNEYNNLNIIDKIDFILNNFAKNSFVSSEKATYLIGKEIEAVKISISNFARNINEISKNNKNLIDKSNTLDVIAKKYQELEKINDFKVKLEQEVKEYDSKISILKEKINDLGKNISNIEKSESYILEKQKEKELENLEENINKEIESLKANIDFKELARIFHTNNKKMTIVKAYKDNFKEEFKKEEKSSLFELLKETNLLTDKIKEQFDKIKEKQKEISKITIENDKTKTLKEEILGFEKNISSLSQEKAEKEKKSQKLDKNKKDILEDIKIGLKKVNFTLLSTN